MLYKKIKKPWMLSLKNVVPNTMVFDSIKETKSITSLNTTTETAFIKKYRPEFLGKNSQFIKDQKIQFKSFTWQLINYNQYALKTNDGVNTILKI